MFFKIGLITCVQLLIFSAVAREPSLFLPPEFIDAIKKDFNLTKNDEIDFSFKPMTLMLRAGSREYKRTISGSGDSIDFADFGKKPKEYALQFQAEPLVVKISPQKVTEDSENEPAEAEHAAAKGHGDKEASANPQKALYFINRYREVQSGGHSYGLPCGKALKIQSQLDDLLINQGIKVKSANGRHLDALGGDFLIVRRDGDEMAVTSFKLRDSRFADRLCKMSFE